MMDEPSTLAEFSPLTRAAVSELLVGRHLDETGSNGNHRRKAPRWPFQGTVELWLPNADGTERHALATSLNLSADGMGIKVDEALTVGAELAVAIHEPEVSFHGRATVRHCTRIDDGYYVGMQFCFDE